MYIWAFFFFFSIQLHWAICNTSSVVTDVKYICRCDEHKQGGLLIFLHNTFERETKRNRLSTHWTISVQITHRTQQKRFSVDGKGYNFSVYHVWYSEQTRQEASRALQTWNSWLSAFKSVCVCVCNTLYTSSLLLHQWDCDIMHCSTLIASFSRNWNILDLNPSI